jgi:hypothetical protein
MGNGSKDKLLEDEGIGESNGAQIVNSSEASRQGNKNRQKAGWSPAKRKEGDCNVG